MKKIVVLMLVFAISIFMSISVGATTMNTTTSLSYTPTISGYDNNGYFSMTQDNVHWTGYANKYWPSGRKIYYSVFSQDYSPCSVYIFFDHVNDYSGNIYYNSGWGYKTNYRVGSYTSSGTADTTFSYYV